MALIDRLELAFKVPPAGTNQLVYTTSDFRGVDFGFRDAVEITGYLCYPSILKYRAANELADLYTILNKPNKVLFYQNIAAKIKKSIPEVFMDKRGLLKASTDRSQRMRLVLFVRGGEGGEVGLTHWAGRHRVDAPNSSHAATTLRAPRTGTGPRGERTERGKQI